MFHNLFDKNMFPVHILKLQKVILNARYIYSKNYENDWDIYLLKREATTVINMPKDNHWKDWQTIFILILILAF